MIGVKSIIFAPIVGTLLLGVLRLVPLAFVVVTLTLFIFARRQTTIVYHGCDLGNDGLCENHCKNPYLPGVPVISCAVELPLIVRTHGIHYDCSCVKT